MESFGKSLNGIGNSMYFSQINLYYSFEIFCDLKDLGKSFDLFNIEKIERNI
jgi:hypothetical protein